MAWIVKDSARMQIERRAEPYVTAAMKSHFEKEILPRYATKQAALLPLMHEIQHEHGWIPPQAIEEAGEFLGLSAAEVYDCVTFYEEFRHFEHHVAPDDLRHDCVAPGATISAIILPEYRAGVRTSLDPVTRGEALHAILRSCFNIARLRRPDIEGLARVVERSAVFRLSIGSTNDAVTAIESVLAPTARR